MKIFEISKDEIRPNFEVKKSIKLTNQIKDRTFQNNFTPSRCLIYLAKQEKKIKLSEKHHIT